MTNKMLRPKKGIFILLFAPGIVWYIFTVILPLSSSLVYSFFSFKGMRIDKFVGFTNYAELIYDKIFWLSLKNNVIITVLCVVGQIGIGLVFAAILNMKMLKFKNLHRSVIFFPGVLSAVIIGFIWTMMYNKDYGLINFILEKLNLDFLILPWLDNPKHVIYFVSIPLIWQYIGYYMVIIMAGMSAISKEVYEMADIDGVTPWGKTVYITMPLIKDTLMVCLMLCISGNMQVFDHILVMTEGGPGTSSMVMAILAYSKTFEQGRIAYGNTVSIGILIISLFFIVVSKLIIGGGKKDAS
ncbi:MAG: sugar ABC transporter permease [Ruminiclostridium sp.]|nr:sugar ABC transporter permease [Ruminiclostridium sp.]